MYHDDPIKKQYDETIQKCATELQVIGWRARACSEVAGYQNGIAMRLQANVAEAMHTALQRIIDSGGMPPLKEINRLMAVPVTMVIPMEELHVEHPLSKESVEQRIKMWSGSPMSTVSVGSEVRKDDCSICAEQLDEERE